MHALGECGPQSWAPSIGALEPMVWAHRPASEVHVLGANPTPRGGGAVVNSCIPTQTNHAQKVEKNLQEIDTASI